MGEPQALRDVPAMRAAGFYANRPCCNKAPAEIRSQSPRCRFGLQKGAT
ncbi:hypothetical protein BRCON_2460 [Candidatus Sumerlaea chitinivorans]|uniref:Uncharacterized protein n=1 Tax=Sumerlaea chitinivorans TaxID=2250252 RepID=A0A2Z4Y7M9_SUMC1|nr:hypothetical protein BRCON_2460 [Candidatus Sumerlaea chitinivorans]